MKQFLLASVGLVAIGTIATSAADIPRRAAPPPPVVAAPVFTWTGAYVGINGGYGWGTSTFSAPFATGSFDVSGGLVGGTLGYNYQIGQAVVGLEGDIDWSGIKGSTFCGGTTCETRNNWLSTVRGRLGYSFDRFMPYITGGLAVGDIETNIAGVGSGRDTKAGWTVGGGVEAVLDGPWTAKVEYLYVDLGRGGTVLGSDAEFKSHIVRGGVNYRF
jgi:outer membrane immunogenic protein